MSTTIDSLQIEIQSRSTNAAKGIDDLAKSLGKLKENGGFRTAVNNLERLSRALDNVPNTHKQSTSLRTLAGALDKLKNVGSLSRLNSSLSGLPTAISGIENINIDGVAPKLQRLAEAAAPLGSIKTGGLGTMVNALSRLDQVTKSLDDDTIDAFAEKVEKLNAKLEPLSQKMTTIQSGLNGINTVLRPTNLLIGQANTKVNVGIFNLSNLTNVLSTCYSLLRRIYQGLSDVIEQASEWDGISSRFGRGFGSQAQGTYEWIQKLNEEMDINIQQFMQYSSTYATMLKGFGVASEDASTMALGYMELTYDVWAGYNDIYKNLDDAATAVRSAISGDTEAIRRAGFSITESTLEQTAANHGLEISFDNATEAQKSYLRYLTLVDQAYSQGLVGTYAEELNTAEGMMRTLDQQLKSLAQTFGSLFIPLLVNGLPYVQAFVELLTEGVQRLAQIMGVEIQSVDFSGYTDGAESVDNLTGSLSGATDAVNEFKNATIGIDELNVINPTSDISTVSSGENETSSPLGDIASLWDQSIFDTIQTDVDNIKKKLEGWMPLIAAIAVALAGLSLLKFTGELSDAILKTGTLATKLNNLSAAKLATSATSANGALSSMGLTLGSLSAGTLLTIALAAVAIGSGIYFISKNWEALKTTASDFFEDKISPKFEKIKGHLDEIKEVLSPLAPLIDPIIEKFREWFGDIDLLEAYGGYLTAVFGGIGLGLIDNFIGFLEGATQIMSGFAQIVSGAFEIVVGVFTLDGEKIVSGAKSISSGVGDVLGGIGTIIVNPFETSLDLISGWFTDIGELILGNDTFSVWVSDIEVIMSSFSQIVDGGFEIVEGIFTLDGEKIIAGAKRIKTGVGDAFGAFGSIFEKARDLVSAWFDDIGDIMLGDTTVSDWISSTEGKIKAFFTQTIPQKWNDLQNWWDNKPELSEIVPTIDDVKAIVSGAWDKARNWWDNSKAKLKTIFPDIVDIKAKIKEKWEEAKRWWQSSVSGLVTTLSIKVPRITVKWDTVTAFGQSFSYPSGFNLSFAAAGGIFDQGSLVWAGERGPEIVANASGGKTGVMNVEQMQEAVYEGVFAAVSAAMSGKSNGGERSVNVYLDGKQITAAVEQRQRERGASIMGNEVYSY